MVSGCFESDNGDKMKRLRLKIIIGLAAVAGIASFYFLVRSYSDLNERRKVVDSIKFALSLEQQAILRSPFNSIEELENFFRQGYGERLAAELAAFNWPHGPDNVMQVPNTVTVLGITDDRAIAYYENPASSLNEDGANRYLLLKLSNANDRWVIEEVALSAVKPSR